MSSIVNKVKNAISHDSADTSTTPHSTHSTSNTADRAENKVADAAASHADRSNTGSTSDRLESKAAHAYQNHEARDNNASTVSSSTTGVADSSNHGAARTGTSGIEQAAENIHEHAHAPHRHHNQPAEDGLLSQSDAKAATHDHQHLAPVTHETRHHHEVEEVERQREVDRHVHHVQHHTQPVLDTQHAAEVQRENIVPTTHVKENHVATDEDKANFAALNTAHDSVADAGKERVIVDKGERVHVNDHHHVHHVVQPEIERDVHDHTKIHTTVPVHQTVHEAPIVHQSTMHEPLRINEFTQGGGDLSSTLKHDANLLNVNGEDCSRDVSGAGITGTHGHQQSTGTTTASTGSSAAGTTGGAL
ncbi:hypothetical protein JCM8547_004150 [Rhodosporidiobolus lusitaniae]